MKCCLMNVRSPKNKSVGKNFRIIPYIDYAFCLIMYPPYCPPRYTSVMNTYSVNKRGFQFGPSPFFFLPTSLFLPLFSPTTLSCTPGFPPFFFGSRRDLKQRFSVALAYLSLFHTTRPWRFVEISCLNYWYLFACSNIHNKTTEMCMHVIYSRFCL